MNRTEQILSNCPDYYRSSRIFGAVIDAIAREFDQIAEGKEEVLEQFFVETATWGLRYWEEECGLPVEPALSYSDRRARILAALRGADNCTLGLVRKVVNSFTGINPTCYETDLFRAGISAVGEPVYWRGYPFTIRRKFLFVVGFSAAGEEVWSEDYGATLMLNISDLFRAGISTAGQRVYKIDPDLSDLEQGSYPLKAALRTALEKVLPARMQLIIN